MEIPIFQVDAFTDTVFRGNPAAVCPLDEWLDDDLLQSVAAENNLSETAFVVGADGEYKIRWFTPALEVDLCGHATLASGYVVMTFLDASRKSVRFDSPSGELVVRRDGDWYQLDFPSRPPEECVAPEGLVEALGCDPAGIFKSRDHLVLLRDQDEVLAVEPDMERMRQVDCFSAIMTAPGDDCDFVSRFFAPRAGVPEDPVTGSSHCTLTPFWAKRLGKTSLSAQQLSSRGGVIKCELQDDRVLMGGQAVLYLQGRISI